MPVVTPAASGCRGALQTGVVRSNLCIPLARYRRMPVLLVVIVDPQRARALGPLLPTECCVHLFFTKSPVRPSPPKTEGCSCTFKVGGRGCTPAGGGDLSRALFCARPLRCTLAPLADSSPNARRDGDPRRAGATCTCGGAVRRVTASALLWARVARSACCWARSSCSRALLAPVAAPAPQFWKHTETHPGNTGPPHGRNGRKSRKLLLFESPDPLVFE